MKKCPNFQFFGPEADILLSEGDNLLLTWPGLARVVLILARNEDVESVESTLEAAAPCSTSMSSLTLMGALFKPAFVPYSTNKSILI